MGLLLLLGAAGRVEGDEVDEYVEAQRKWMHVPGLTLAVVHDSRLATARGYGMANLEHAVPARPDTPYKIGSLSKQFLAAGVLVLAQDGKLKLDDPVRLHLDVPDEWRGVTVRHLLSHTSGLAREFPRFDPFRPVPGAEALKDTALRLAFAPGERWAYSNVGYYLVAEVIAKVSGKPWSEFLHERVFAPAGMHTTRTTTADLVPGRAAGYEVRGRAARNAPDWLVVRPSGAFLTTATDLARWDLALSGGAVLREDSMREMWTPVRLTGGKEHPYGLGWFVDSVRGHRRVRHDGGVPGFSAEFQRFPEDRLTVIALANAGGRDLGDLVLRVAGFYRKELLPPAEQYLEDRDPRVTEGVKATLAGFVRGKIDQTLFEEMLGATLRQEVQAGFGEDIRALGPALAVGLLERKAENGVTEFRYRVHYAHVPLYVRCAVDANLRFTRFAIHD